MSLVRWASCASLLSCIVVGSSGAQAPAGMGVFSGSVSDPSGARVAHATVIVQVQGSSALETSTDGTGLFALRLPVGSFEVTIASPGFRAFQAQVEIPAAGAVARLNAVLAIDTEPVEITVPSAGQASTASRDNAGALIFRSDQLKEFSDDDATFQREIEALAGGTGPRPPQILIDGFTGGRFPPKSAIREIRINSNPYSAEFENLGFGRFEVFTKPGKDKLHGQLSLSGTDDVLNGQNPFLHAAEPPYFLLNVDGNLNGPLDRRTSFYLAGTLNDQQNNAAINAQTVDPVSLQAVTVAQAVRDPLLANTYSLRVDRQATPTNTLAARYEFSQLTMTNGGLTAPLTLASAAYDSGTTTQTLQLSDTQVIGSQAIEESRFQYVRTRLQQGPVSSAPTLLVEGGFNGGGSNAQLLEDHLDRFEFQQLYSRQSGTHFLRLGARYRLQREANLSEANYNGQYTFASLAAYQRTLQGLAAGETPAQIRAAGGGASQFNLTAGQPSATILTGDLAAYADDEWKPRRNLTVDLGFRFESQSAIPHHSDPAPRVGVAWALHRRGKRPTFLLLRGGGGVFYDRFPAADLLTAVRQNGVSQQTYYLENPDTYPGIPSTASLSSSAPTVYRVSPTFRSEYGWVGGLSAEKFLGRHGQVSFNYVAIRGVHEWGSWNINAPLPGTYNPMTGTGVRPLGGTQNVYEFHSEGIQKMQLGFINSRLTLGRRVTAFLSYTAIHTDQDVGAPTTFASNSYNLRQDFGRALQPSQQLYVGGTVALPAGISANVFASTQGGIPFNITTGTDLNGDTIYNDRPAFATAPTASSVIYHTRYGVFDANPQPGEKIIPVNYGNSPDFAFLEVSLARSFAVGRRPPAPAAVAGKPAPRRPEAPASLTFTVDGLNLLNHTNPAPPVGVLSSPYFGQSITQNTALNANTAANRTIFLQMSLSF